MEHWTLAKNELWAKYQTKVCLKSSWSKCLLCKESEDIIQRDLSGVIQLPQPTLKSI